MGGANLVGEFYAVFAATMRDVGTPVLARYFFERMFERVGDDCRIVIVRVADHTAAAALLTQHGDTVEIPWAGNLRRFRPAAANMRLYWECLKYAVETRHRRFDFGRSTVDSGTYHFKAQWGARPVALHWLYPLQSAGSVMATQERPVLKLARFVWGKLPVPAATRLAASFSAGLPW